MLGKLPVPGRPANLDYSRTGAYCACSSRRWGCLDILSFIYHFLGGRVVRRCWVNFQCRGVLLIWITVGQGPIVLAVGAGGVVWTFCLSSINFRFFLPLSGRRPDID